MLHTVFVISNSEVERISAKTATQEKNDSFVLIGSSDSSVDGISMIEKLRPNIVIMPQYMTFLNAADLIRNSQSKCLNTQFILYYDNLQSFEMNFLYSSAVSSGLKRSELQLNHILDALDKAGEDWDRNFKQDFKPQTLNFDNWLEQQASLSELITGVNSSKDTEIKLPDFPEAIKKPCWLLLISTSNDTPAEFSLYSNLNRSRMLAQKLNDFFYSYQGGILCMLHQDEACILLSSSVIKNYNQFHDFPEQLNHALRPINFPPVLIDVCERPVNVHDWHKAYQELRELHQNRFFLGDIPLLLPSMIKKPDMQPLYTKVKLLIEDLCNAVYSLSETQILASIDALFDQIQHSLSYELLSYTWNQLLLRYSMFVQNYGLSEEEYSSKLTNKRNRSLVQYHEASNKMYTDLLLGIKQISDDKNIIVKKAIAIIKEDLQTQYTLTSIAQAIHVSPSYLSRLFKKETGYNFVDYVNYLRIEEAKRLFSTFHKVGDIGPLVGFENSKYFSQVFKRYTGQTPQQYRTANYSTGDGN